jgi:hypothetical protein
VSESNKRVQAWADPKKGSKHLRGLTCAQRADYNLYRRKGFSMAEALALVAPATPA